MKKSYTLTAARKGDPHTDGAVEVDGKMYARHAHPYCVRHYAILAFRRADGVWFDSAQRELNAKHNAKLIARIEQAFGAPAIQPPAPNFNPEGWGA